jgi:two-component system, NarL family, invasion response regulator UvrY
MYRVLICDDHPVTRAGIREFLEEDPRIAHVGESATADEALARIRQEPWHLVLLDICMPGRSGLDVIAGIRAAGNGVKVLIVSSLPERQLAIPALRAGADGFLAKADAPRDLLHAVRMVIAGGRFLSPALVEVLAEELCDENRKRPAHDQLSAREFQVLCKLASGRTLRIIAEEIGLNIKTVRACRTRILRKMRFSANADITVYAYREGLIP